MKPRDSLCGVGRRRRLGRMVAFLSIGLSAAAPSSYAQDTTAVQDAVYSRPFIASVGRTAIGGYVEGNTNYFVEDGVTDGFSMELRRFNIFVFSAISPRIRFISELEFEHGTEEIALETALIDLRINPAFTLRGGILLPPIGAFNQNHDSPFWEFIDRPLVSTEIIPATLSEVGFGAYGKWFSGPYVLTYDLYLTNGLGDGIVANEEGRTFVPAGKHERLFEEDNNGSPALSGRLAFQRRGRGEIGASFYTGIYNTYRAEGEQIDAKRRVTILALDFQATLVRTFVRGEFALARIDVQEDLVELFGNTQWGVHVDIVVQVWHLRFPGHETGVLNANLRLEAVDFNAGTFSSTGERIFDQLYAIVPGVSYRPSSDTVLRVNYRRHWFRDFVGNPTIHTGGIQLGFATYF